MKELRCFRHRDFSEPAKTLRHEDVLALINTGTKKLRHLYVKAPTYALLVLVIYVYLKNFFAHLYAGMYLYNQK